MDKLKKVGKVLGILLVVLVVGVGVAYGWASWKTSSLLAQTFESPAVDFPIPFPLTEAEVEALRQERMPPEPEPEHAPEGEAAEGEVAEGEVAEAETEDEAEPPAPVDPLEGVDLDAIALERAVERGRHLVDARYACVECHGDDFSGGVMVEDPALGNLRGPNLTGGAGSRVGEWSAATWDRAVRHGIFPDGTASLMPAEDYRLMSDRELSDVIAYIRTFDPVDNEVVARDLGPMGIALVAVGLFPLSPNTIDHSAEHPELPPEAEPTAEFGEHLLAVCTGCHGSELNGGPQPGAPPEWAIPSNLTPHEQGLAGWDYDDFVTAMREMQRPDGTALQEPMTVMERYTANMTETELQAMWAYLQSIDPVPTGT